MKKLSGMEQPKVRWSDKEIIELLGIEAFLKASEARKSLRKTRKDVEWILVPSMNLKMVTVIGAEEFDKGQNGTGAIIHDHLYKLQA